MALRIPSPEGLAGNAAAFSSRVLADTPQVPLIPAREVTPAHAQAERARISNIQTAHLEAYRADVSRRKTTFAAGFRLSPLSDEPTPRRASRGSADPLGAVIMLAHIEAQELVRKKEAGEKLPEGFAEIRPPQLDEVTLGEMRAVAATVPVEKVNVVRLSMGLDEVPLDTPDSIQ